MRKKARLQRLNLARPNASGAHLKSARIDCGLSRDEAAQRIGRSRSTIARWEREGITENISVMCVIDACMAYGISVDGLIEIAKKPIGILP